MFEWSLSIGSVLTILMILASGIAFYTKQERDSIQFKEDIHDIKSDLKQLNAIIINLALQTERLDNQAKRIDRIENHLDEVKHGKGFIT